VSTVRDSRDSPTSAERSENKTLSERVQEGFDRDKSLAQTFCRLLHAVLVRVELLVAAEIVVTTI
jgi:hypothetical protein